MVSLHDTDDTLPPASRRYLRGIGLGLGSGEAGCRACMSPELGGCSIVTDGVMHSIGVLCSMCFRCELQACLDGSLTYFGIAEKTWRMNSGLSRHMFPLMSVRTRWCRQCVGWYPIRSSRPRWITGRRRREEHHKSATRTRRRQTVGTGLRLGWWKSGTPSCCTTFVRHDDETRGSEVVPSLHSSLHRCYPFIFIFPPPVSRVVWFDFLRLF